MTERDYGATQSDNDVQNGLIFPGTSECLSPQSIEHGLRQGLAQRVSHIQGCKFCQSMIRASFRVKCPPVGLLVEFLRGSLDSAMKRGIDDHLEEHGCVRCALTCGAIEAGAVHGSSQLADAFWVPPEFGHSGILQKQLGGVLLRANFRPDAAVSISMRARRDYSGFKVFCIRATVDGDPEVAEAQAARLPLVPPQVSFGALPEEQRRVGMMLMFALLAPLQSELECLDPERIWRAAFDQTSIPFWDQAHIDGCIRCQSRIHGIISPARRRRVLEWVGDVANSLRPPQLANHTVLGEHRNRIEADALRIRGGELNLAEVFEPSDLKEFVPWAGPSIRILPTGSPESPTWFASVQRLLGTKQDGTIRVEVEDAEGRRSEIRLTGKYGADEFPDALGAELLYIWISIE